MNILIFNTSSLMTDFFLALIIYLKKECNVIAQTSQSILLLIGKGRYPTIMNFDIFPVLKSSPLYTSSCSKFLK